MGETNARGGTDHGTANTMLLIGGGLKRKGLINNLPDLENLVEGGFEVNVPKLTIEVF